MRIWLENLGVGSLLLLVTERRLGYCREIIYFEKGFLFGFCCWFLRLLKPGMDIRLAEYSLGDLKNDDGRILRYCIEERLSEAVSLIQKDLEGMGLLRRSPWSRFPCLWAVRYLAHEVCFALYTPVVAIHIFGKLAEDKDLLLLCTPSFESHLRAVGLLDSPSVVVRGSRIAALVRGLTLPVAFAAVLGASLVNLFLRIAVYRRVGRKRPNTEVPMVGVQYCWGHNIHGISDIYWLKNSGVLPHQVQFYFNRPDTPLTAEHIKEFNRYGYAKPIHLGGLFSLNSIRRFLAAPCKSLYGSKKSRRLRNTHAWQPPAIMFWEMIWLSLATAVSLGRSLLGPDMGHLPWIGRCTFKMIYEVGSWRYFFQDNNIKVNINHSGDTGNGHTAQTLAMHLTNGVNVRSNYSYMPVLSINHSREFHVYFPWGRKPRCDMNKEQIYSCYVVYAGYIFDSLFHDDSAQKELPALEQCLLRAAVFDECFDEFANYSRDVVSRFYGALFRLAKTIGLGLYIKSKRYDRDALFQFFPGFAEAEASGNMVVLDNRLRPYQALQHADLAVCLGINSAGIETALYGMPTIYWVHDDSTCEQLEISTSSRLVFHDLEELTDLLRRALDDRTALHGFGDHSDIADEIDPFRDGQAGNRIGSYINSYLKNIVRLMDREESLEACNEEYRRLWGDDKVSCMSLDSLRPHRT